MLNSVIMGFGHCGKNLHLHCLRKLASANKQLMVDSMVDVVDPAVVTENNKLLRHHCDLPHASNFAEPVLHICTPPATHAANLFEALEKGYRRIILEKPMAPSLAEAHAMIDATNKHDAEVLVVSVWTNSNLTARLLRKVGIEDFTQIEVIHNKARFSRTFDRENEHVFEIEMPHQLSLVLPFLGNNARLLSALTSDLKVNEQVRTAMGRGEIVLQGCNDGVVRLVSNLDHPTRERSITIHFRSGEKWVGNYPVSSDDSYSQLFKYSRQNILVAHEAFKDDPLLACLSNYYRHWANNDFSNSIPLGAALDFNLRVVTLIDQAKKINLNKLDHVQNFEKHLQPTLVI